MTEESKTEAQKTVEPKSSEEQTVTISQEKLNSLINEKFKKGAEKSKAELLSELGVESIDDLKGLVQAKKEAEEAQKTELQKLQEAIELEKAEKAKLEKRASELEKANTINSIAAKHGVKEIDYFALQLEKANVGDDFNMDEFINGLKESKPFVFGEVKTPKVDTSGNNQQDPNDIKQVVQGLSLKQLKELQKKL